MRKPHSLVTAILLFLSFRSAAVADNANGGIVWSSYLGGANEEHCNGVVVDASGNVIVTGTTNSPGWVSGGYNTSFNGNIVPAAADGYVVKLNNNGARVWSTYLGGGNEDHANAVAVDTSGNIYVAGSTSSSGWVSGGFDASFSGSQDGFVVKLSPTGAHVWSTYLGGGNDDALAIGVRSSNVYVAGSTGSSGWASGGYDTSFGGGTDGFVIKVTTSGTAGWSTFLGGTGQETGDGLAIDSSGNIYAVGATGSAGWIQGGYDTILGGSIDGYVVKLADNGATSAHLWSSYIGGVATDSARAVSTHLNSSIYITGSTFSSGWVSGGYDTTFSSGDAFLVRLNGGGKHIWSTYIGGTQSDAGSGVKTDPVGNIYVVGNTRSAGWTSGGFNTIYAGGVRDAFMVKINILGVHLWSSYFGGGDDDMATSVAIDGSGRPYLAGDTLSSGWIAGGYDTTLGGGGNNDGFVAKIGARNDVSPDQWAKYE